MQSVTDAVQDQLTTTISQMPRPSTPIRTSTYGTQTEITDSPSRGMQTTTAATTNAHAQTVSTCADKDCWIASFARQDGKTGGGGGGDDDGNKYYMGDDDDDWEEGEEEEQLDPDECCAASSIAASTVDVGWPRPRGRSRERRPAPKPMLAPPETRKKSSKDSDGHDDDGNDGKKKPHQSTKGTTQKPTRLEIGRAHV